jgi:hypothetical protein
MHPRYHVVVEPHSNRLTDPAGHLEPLAGAVGVDQEEFLARSDRGAALDDHAPHVGDTDGDVGVVRAIGAARAPRDADAAVVEGGRRLPGQARRPRASPLGLGSGALAPASEFVDQPSEAWSASGGTEPGKDKDGRRKKLVPLAPYWRSRSEMEDGRAGSACGNVPRLAARVA